MCLVTLALDLNSRFPFVMAGNRDEFFARETARLGWWELPGQAPILGGRDVQAGGTWLGLTAHGRLAVVTNYRQPSKDDREAPSRGAIVPLWLKGHKAMHELWPELAMSGFNGFNLLAIDFAQGECFWGSNTARYPKRLERGLYGLSNGHLDSDWPKVQHIKTATRQAVQQSATVDELANALFEALADTQRPADDLLPHTGISLEWERVLSPAFIRTPDGNYGTRSSTLVITERVNKRLVTHVFERTYGSGARMALLRKVTLRNWPPRHTMQAEQLAKLDQSLLPSAMRQEDRFESSDVHEQEGHTLVEAPARKTRARSLIKPSRPSR